MYATNAQGVTPVLTTSGNDGFGMNGAGWLLPFLLFGANGRGWGGYGGPGNDCYNGGMRGGCNTGCGCGPTLASELGKAGNEALRDQLSNLATSIASDKSAAQTASVIAAVNTVENQITNMLNAGQLSDCAKQAELIRAIDQCCCMTKESICGLNTTVLMGNQTLANQAATNAMNLQHSIDTGFCGVNGNIDRSMTALSTQLCMAVRDITSVVKDDGDKTRSMLHDAEVQELRDKLAQCSNDAQTARLETMMAGIKNCVCGCGCGSNGGGHHHSNSNNNGNSQS